MPGRSGVSDTESRSAVRTGARARIANAEPGALTVNSTVCVLVAEALTPLTANT